jgi:hypothetical protein
MRLIYFSPVPWTSFAQRPHRFVEWFHSKSKEDVLWIDPYPTRLPKLADFRRRKTAASGTKNAANKSVPDWLTLLRPRSLPIEPLPGSGFLHRQLWNTLFQEIKAFVAKGECRFAIGKPSELALQVLARHPTINSHYDAMDDFPAFYQGLSRAAMQRREQKLATQVTQISVSSSALLNRFATHHSKLTLALNACSLETLPSLSEMIHHSGKPNLILGYVGTIGHWFDWPLVVALAQANPTMCIRLIGPIFTSPHQPLPDNIELLPACDHATAIKHMQEFSIGLIPFQLTDLTASVDPIKYYEYRALGLPVISTNFGEMSLRDEKDKVFVIHKNADLANVVRKAMASTCEVDEVQKFRRANSWEVRFDSSEMKIPNSIV